MNVLHSSSYSKRFEQYVIANELKDEKKDCSSFLDERREQRLQPIEGLKGPSQAFRIQACRTVGNVEQPFPTETNHYCGASSLSQAWSRRRGRNGGLRRSTKTVFGTLRVRRIPWASIKGQICLWIAKQANPKEAANWNRTNLEKGPWYGHSHGISRKAGEPFPTSGTALKHQCATSTYAEQVRQKAKRAEIVFPLRWKPSTTNVQV